MDVEFAVPISLTDLQTKKGLSDYSVSEVFSSQVLLTKLSGKQSDGSICMKLSL